MSGSARAKGMTGYRTLAAKGEAELVIQRSRFIGRGFPVESEAAALAIDKIKEHVMRVMIYKKRIPHLVRTDDKRIEFSHDIC